MTKLSRQSDQTDMRGLLPCPFCGKQPNISVLDTTHPKSRWIRCSNPECAVSSSVGGRTLRQVKQLWNTRKEIR